MKKLFCILFVMIGLAACRHDCPMPTSSPKSADFTRLEVGNFWIYQIFKSDSGSNFQPTNVFDTTYIERDSLMNGHRYFKMRSTYYENFLGANSKWWADSSDYLIASTGERIFNALSNDILYIKIIPNFWNFHIKMNNAPQTISTPSGTYQVLESLATYELAPMIQVGSRYRYDGTRYFVRGIGVVKERCYDFVSSYPIEYEKRLVHYGRR